MRDLRMVLPGGRRVAEKCLYNLPFRRMIYTSDQYIVKVYSFIHSSNKHLSGTYYVAGCVLQALGS